MKKTIRSSHPGLQFTRAAMTLAVMSGCFLFDSSSDPGDDYIYEPVSLNEAPVVVVSISSSLVSY